MSGIEWTQLTWNPVTGCDRTSSGCDHCYALNCANCLTYATGWRTRVLSGYTARGCQSTLFDNPLGHAT